MGDMDGQHRREFKKSVSIVYAEAHTMDRRLAYFRSLMEVECPWSQPTNYRGLARCRDLSTCNIFSDPRCCDAHGGFLQCPADYPVMCADRSCNETLSTCAEHGGMMGCPALEQCAWILPTAGDDVVECKNGVFYNIHRFGGAGWCQDYGGLKRCPYNLPNMCEAKCGDEHCCAVDCEELGGNKPCYHMRGPAGGTVSQTTTPHSAAWHGQPAVWWPMVTLAWAALRASRRRAFW